MKRQRTRASKGRKGCLACKRKHVRCDEGKPGCTRCQQSRSDCIYDPIRLFEVKPIPKPRGVAAKTRYSLQPLPALNLHALSQEEVRALHLWTAYSGPRLANYGAPHARPLWETVLPRCASSLPALRHIMIAITLLDNPLQDRSTAALSRQYAAILKHYNAGIALLTRDARTTLMERAMSALLTWALEVMGFNVKGAGIHLVAARKLSNSWKTDMERSETDEILNQYLPATLDYCEGYASTLVTPYDSDGEESNPILKGLTVRESHDAVGGIEECVCAIEYYFNFMLPAVSNEGTAAEARRYAHRWKVSIIQFRYTSTTAYAIILLGYLSMGLGELLLPSKGEEAIRGERLFVAENYILARARDVAVLEMSTEDARMRDRLLSLITAAEMPTDRELGLLSRQTLAGCDTLNGNALEDVGLPVRVSGL